MSIMPPSPFHRFGDVSVRLSVELGRTEMALRDVLMLGEGSTVALDRLTDELLDVTANGRVIARGEVVADKGRFALRIVSLVGEDGEDMPPVHAPASAASGTPAAPAPAPAPAAAAPATGGFTADPAVGAGDVGQ